jgi:hypothetical protein
MFYANILYHNTRFDPRTSHVRKITLTINVPSNIEEEGLPFRFIVYTKLKKELF